ncbi:hypothetical protein [Aestuariivirga sp.]|uniref:hypothetical protein n=1 Tax=Aestuariivirga sp. TaxID=2650926 RepID=UPI0035B0F332
MEMNRRTIVSMLGISLSALSVPAMVVPALAKDSSGGGDGGDHGSDGGDGKDAKPVEQDGNASSTTDQPGTEAQPQDATQCAAGTDCTKK